MSARLYLRDSGYRARPPESHPALPFLIAHTPGLEGLGHIPGTGPAIIAANHISILDAPLVFMLLERSDATGLVADKYLMNPFIRWLVNRVRGIWINRDAADLKAMRAAVGVTLNSPRPRFFERYHRPRGFSIQEAVASLIKAKEKGVYTSINLLVFPGFTDREDEVEGLIDLIRKTDLDLIRMRNLNIDPDLYLKEMGRGEGIGISKMLEILKREFPRLQFGYFNRTKENFK